MAEPRGARRNPLPNRLVVVAFALFVADVLIIWFGTYRDQLAYETALSASVGLQCTCAILAMVIASIDRKKRPGAKYEGGGLMIASVTILLFAGIAWVVGIVILSFATHGDRGAFGGG